MPSGKPKRVLIVEDDAMCRQAMARLLRHLGVEVDEASSVAQAIFKLAAAPHCVLLDMHLPDGEGTEVLRAARAAGSSAAMAFVTGSVGADDLQRLRHSHPDKVFIKPVRPDDLLSWVIGVTAERCADPDPLES